MAKKEVSLFEVKDGKIYILEEDLPKLTDADNTKIAFYAKTLGYEVVFTKPEPKKKNTFKIGNAIAYIEATDKKYLKEFNAMKAEADKLADAYKELATKLKDAEAEGSTVTKEELKQLKADAKAAQKAMIIAQRDAFTAQKDAFKAKYGQEAYDQVRMM